MINPLNISSLEERLKYYAGIGEENSSSDRNSIVLNFFGQGYSDSKPVYTTSISNDPIREFMDTLLTQVLEKKDGFYSLKKEFFKPKIVKDLTSAPWMINYVVQGHNSKDEIHSSTGGICILPHKIVNVGDCYYFNDVSLMPSKNGNFDYVDHDNNPINFSDIKDKTFHRRSYELNRTRPGERIDRAMRHEIKRSEVYIVKAEY